jgi:predicted nucleic acid-binding protein
VPGGPPLFLDTNVILRYLTRDDPDQSPRAYDVFRRVAAGELAVVTTEAVIAEVVHVLASKALFNLPRNDVRIHLLAILGFGGLSVPAKPAIVRALDLYVGTNLPFVDTVIVAHMERERIGAVLSFDRGFDRVPGITREEP